MKLQQNHLSGIANLMLTEYQLDTLKDLNQIRYWISRPNNLNDRYALIESFIEEGDFANAYNFYNGIANDFDLRDQQETAYLEFADYLQLRELIFLDDRTIAELDSLEILELENMAVTFTGHTQRYAANILCFFYQNCQYIPIQDPQHSSRPQATQIQVEPEVPEALQLFKVYPNPAGNFTSIAWEIEEVLTKTYLEVFDINGKVMSRHTINVTIGEWVVDTRNFPNGVYTCRMVSNGNILQSQSLMINK